jgi:hypothetical protein
MFQYSINVEIYPVAQLVVCKHFASYQDYTNYRWDLIRYAKYQVGHYTITLEGCYKHGSGSKDVLRFLIACKSTQELESECVWCCGVTRPGGYTRT